MKRLFLAPALGALALATATPAFAQYGRPDNRRPSYGYSPYAEARRIAYDNGFREGVEEGIKDARSRDRFYFQDEGDFKHADKGYNRSLGDRDRYREAFRSGFADGYADGYRRYSRGSDNRRWDDRDIWRNPYEIGARDGYEKGREDARDRDRYDPRAQKWYREGDREYDSRYGSRDRYKDEYRRGFVTGYDRGYREAKY